MNLMGWIFLAVSLTFVWTLVGWCFYRVIHLPPERDVAEPVKDFRSA